MLSEPEPDLDIFLSETDPEIPHTENPDIQSETEPETPETEPEPINPMSSNPPLFLLPTEEKFNGSNWIAFSTTIRSAVKGRSLLGYLDGTIKKPSPSPSAKEVPTTYWGSTFPTTDEWDQCDAFTQSMISLNVVNPVGQGVKLDGTAQETWASLTSLHDATSDLGMINAEEALSAVKYVAGSPIEKHFEALRTAWKKANDQGANIDDRKFRTIILKSMPKTTEWKVVISSLLNVKTSIEVITALTTHAMLDDNTAAAISPAQSTHALFTQNGGKRTLKNPDQKCDNCGRQGHLGSKCFRTGGGMEGQFPDWWKGSKSLSTNPTANSATTAPAVPPVPPVVHSAVVGANNAEAFDERLAFSALSVANIERNAPVISYADSAASKHFFVDRGDFETYGPVPKEDKAGSTADGGEFDIQGMGRVRKVVVYEGKKIELTFDNAMHAPNLTHNLISIGCLDQKGCYTLFGGGCATFYTREGKPFMRGEAHNSTMYRIEFIQSPVAMSARSLTRPTDLETWHRRLGHVGESTLREMVSKDMCVGLDVTKKNTAGRCEDCILGKHARRPFDDIVVPESRLNERVCFDLWGPARVQTTGGKVYMMLAVDQGGGGVEGYFLANKEMETTVEVLETYHVKSERQTGLKLLYIRTDEGPEFVNSKWKAYCQKFGIIHETTAPYSSSANGVVERANRTVLDRGRSMMIESGLASKYWGEAMATAVYLMDFIPSSRHPGKTMFEVRTGQKPDIAHLRPFGCIAYAKIPKEKGGSKLDARSIKCALIGYFGRGDYKVLDRSTGAIFRSRDVIFEEGAAHRTITSLAGPSTEGETLDDFLPVDEPTPTAPTAPAPTPPTALNPPAPVPAPAVVIPRRSERIRNPSTAATNAADTESRIEEGAEKGLDWARDNTKSTNTALFTTPGYADAAADYHWFPKSYSEAMTRPDLWKEPMDKEIGKMHERKVWTLVERPKGARTMKNRWVFANKYDEHGKIVGRKARLVAKGFTQIPGVDFFASYASVVRYESLRINLAVGTALDMEMWQIDYTSAYLNAPNQVPILMEQPEGYALKPSEVYEMLPAKGERLIDDEKVDDEKELVALVDKAIYGTMDGAYNWWKALNEETSRLGYTRSRADQSVRWKKVGNERTILSLYTDDVNGISTTTGGAALAIKELGEKYDLKDLGAVKFILGIHVDRDRDRGILTMSQYEYLKRVLERYHQTLAG